MSQLYALNEMLFVYKNVFDISQLCSPSLNVSNSTFRYGYSLYSKKGPCKKDQPSVSDNFYLSCRAANPSFGMTPFTGIKYNLLRLQITNL